MGGRSVQMKFNMLLVLLVGMMCGIAFAAITIDPIARTFTKTGGAAAVLTSGNGTWMASTDSDWISIKPRTSGDAGASCVYVVSKNMSTDTRVGQVTIDGNVHTVTQTGYDATLDTNEVTTGMDGTTGEVTITVDAGISWTIASDVDWVLFDVTSGVGTYTVHYTIAPYAGIVTRTASIRIAGQNFVVAQTGKDVELTPTSAYVESDAGIIEVRVTALETTRWNVSVDAEWVYVVDGDTGSGDSTLIISFAANESFNDRSTIVTIGSASFLLKQKGVDKVQVNLSQYEVTANPSGAYGSIGVTATPGGPWTATSLSSWLTIAGYGGEGNGSIEYVASPNLTLESRTGTIEVVPAVRTPNPDIYAGLIVAFDLSSVGDPDVSESSQSGSGHRWSPKLVNYTYNGVKELLGNDIPLGEGGEFTYAASYYVDAIDQINRLFMIGDKAFYLDESNRICMNNSVSASPTEVLPDTWHTVLVEQNKNNVVKIYEGVRGAKPSLMLVIEGCRILEETSSISPTNFVRNMTMLPSRGILEGKCEYQRIWNRVLSNDELPYVDLIEAELAEKPYMPPDWYCLYLPLNGNMYASRNGIGVFKGGNLAGYSTVTNRHGVPGHALCASQISVTGTEYGGPQALSFWMKIPEYPISQMLLSIEKNANTMWASGGELNYILVNQWGKLSVRSTLGESGPWNQSSEQLPLNEWFLLTVVDSGDQDKHENGRIYINGHEVARGYFNFCGSLYTYIKMPNWEIDDVCRYQTSLTSSQILELYNNTKPTKKYYTVTQDIIEPALSPNKIDVAVSGGLQNVNLTMGPGVAWTAESNADWLTITSGTSGSGSASISINVEANSRAESRVGTITVAGLTLTVRQEPLWSEVENDTPFPPAEDGGYGIITVTTEGNAAWQAVSDASWLTIIDDGDHNGTDSVMWAADPYTDTTKSRTGTIRVADHIIYITQRGYELSVEPRSKTASSTGETGQIYVSADSEIDIWDVVATEPWIIITSGNTGVGSKTVTYRLDDNTTGAMRTGSIMIAGVEYVITQTAKVNLNATAVGHGTIVGGGEYEANDIAQLIAKADSGYVFSSWGGDVFGVTTNITVAMDRTKAVTATFIPESAAQQIAKDRGAQGEGLYTRDQIHALEMGNLVLDVDSASGTARVGVRLMESSDLSNPDGWTPVGISQSDIDIDADGTVGLNVEATGNTKFFKVVVPENR